MALPVLVPKQTLRRRSLSGRSTTKVISDEIFVHGFRGNGGRPHEVVPNRQKRLLSENWQWPNTNVCSSPPQLIFDDICGVSVQAAHCRWTLLVDYFSRRPKPQLATNMQVSVGLRLTTSAADAQLSFLHKLVNRKAGGTVRGRRTCRFPPRCKNSSPNCIWAKRSCKDARSHFLQLQNLLTGGGKVVTTAGGTFYNFRICKQLAARWRNSNL